MPGPVRTIDLEAAPGSWRFSSAPPAADLAGAVVEYWEVQGSLAPFRERVLSNGCAELMIDLGPPHDLITEQGTSVWDRSWFSGLHDGAIVIESRSGTHLLSARLHPLGASLLLGARVAGAVNRVIDGEAFLGPDARVLRDRALTSGSIEDRFLLLEEFLRSRPAPPDVPSRHTREAAHRIEEAHGNLRIVSLHEELGISRKHLWACFTREMGISPKGYARIRRFVWTLERLRESESVDWAALAFDAGYSDQSHLARDFRRMASASPTEFLRTRSPDGTALLAEPG